MGKQVFDCEAICIGSVTENEAKTSILVIFSYVDRVRESFLLKMGRYKFTENLKEKAKTEDEKRRWPTVEENLFGMTVVQGIEEASETGLSMMREPD